MLYRWLPPACWLLRSLGSSWPCHLSSHVPLKCAGSLLSLRSWRCLPPLLS